MKANELRIGNYVQLDGLKRPIKVSIIDTTETNSITKYKPIPPTEEWFLKFGLKKFSTNENEYAFELWDGSRYFIEKRGNKWFVDDYGNNFHLEIKYIHSLQNLYFALTGQELTIKNLIK